MKRFFGLALVAAVFATIAVTFTTSVRDAGAMAQLREVQLRRYSYLNGTASTAPTDSGGLFSLPLHTTSSVSCTTQAIRLGTLDQTGGGMANLSSTSRVIGWVTFTHTASWAPALDSLIVYAQYSDDGSNWGVSSALIAGVSTATSRFFKVMILGTQNSSATDVTADGASFVRFIISATDAGAVYGNAKFKFYQQTNAIDPY